MDKVRLAQSLISIADELDENGLIEDVNILDNIIKAILADVHQTNMTKKAQYDTNMQQQNSVGVRKRDYRGLPMPFYGETKDSWYKSLSPEDKNLVHQNYGSMMMSAGGGEADTALANLQDLSKNSQQGQQSAQPAQSTQSLLDAASKNPSSKFLGNDVTDGGAWYQNPQGYWHIQNGQWQKYDRLPGQ